jgi:hypothetical protein
MGVALAIVRTTYGRSVSSVATKMADGNIDGVPQAAARPLSAVFAFDTLGIYRSPVYILWNDQATFS